MDFSGIGDFFSGLGQTVTGTNATSNNNYVSTDPTQNVFSSTAAQYPNISQPTGVSPNLFNASSPYGPVPQTGGGQITPFPSQQYPGFFQPANGGTSSSGGAVSAGIDPNDTNAINQWNARNAQAQADAQNAMRNQISTGYDQYNATLNDMLNNGLPAQRSAQEDIANSQYNQGANTLGTQNTQGQAQLETQRGLAEKQQAKTLRDIANNIRSSMDAGGLYLGARGAGDSSAANQYAYALTKLGTQQRGQTQDQSANIFNDIGQRETNLTQNYNTALQNLNEDRNQKISQVASWFADAQNQLKQAQANGQLNKAKDLETLSQNLYNQGIAQINQIQAASQNSQAQLQYWAANNARNIQELKANMAAIGGQTYAPVQAPAFNGGPQGGAGQTTPYFPGAPMGNQKTDVFGNIIQ